MITYRKLPEIMYTEIAPTPVKEPKLVIYNDTLAKELGLDASVWKSAELLAGHRVPEAFTPIAQAYYGHQFGHLVELGDGRAILLDEVMSSSGRRYDIQLKGSGQTPYSRRGDGRAALGSMLREYLVSEAMHALGIPTTRSLAVASTGMPVYRTSELPGAVLTRVAASHLRVGTMQYAAANNVIKEVADYVIDRHDPDCRETSEPYLCLFRNVLKRQAKLIALWQSVGFIHGVMNTDNMALSGETIDYGPCAFMETYRSSQVFSSIDLYGRYRYDQQPLIAQWNLARLAETLIPLVDEDPAVAAEILTRELDAFPGLFDEYWLEQFNLKLGLDPAKDNKSIIEEFLLLLEEEEKDFTNAFLSLSDHPDLPLFDSDRGERWQEQWQTLGSPTSDKAARQTQMLKVNPRAIPRNFLLDEVLEQAEAGDLAPFERMLAVVTKPYADTVPEEYCTASSPTAEFVTYCGT